MSNTKTAAEYSDLSKARRIGQCGANQTEFKTIVTNVSLSDLQKLDDYAASTVSGSSAIGNYEQYGLGTYIANSLIVCAPNEVINDVERYRQYTYTDYIDVDKDKKYSENGDILLDNYTYDVKTSIDGDEIDTGQYDLVITDAYGRMAALNPPFNDIDTKYFSVASNNGNTNTYTTYRNSIGNTICLTLQSDIANGLSQSTDFIQKANLSYTPILSASDQKQVDGLINSNIPQVYVHQITNEDKYTYWVPFTAEEKPDETSHAYEVSFTSILENVNQLKAQSSFSSYDMGDGTTISTMKELLEYVYSLQKRIKDLESKEYIYRVEGSSITHLWGGSLDDYESKWKNPPLGTDISNIGFLINENEKESTN